MQYLMNQVALVSESASVSGSELSKVSAALQKQATRDFAPFWNVEATVDAFERLEDVPLGYWPVVIQDDINTPLAAGVHRDDNGQPYALVKASPSWPLTTSHEILEMLADPFGNRLIAGQSPMDGQGRVEFLVEVCDPCEDSSFGYWINGVLVSDFYTPRYFDPVGNPSVQYSFTGAIKNPREVINNGYLSWHDPVSNHWFQLTMFNGMRAHRDLGVLGNFAGSLREQIDKMTPEGEGVMQTAAQGPRVAMSAALTVGIDKATAARAGRLRQLIGAVKKAPLPAGGARVPMKRNRRRK